MVSLVVKNVGFTQENLNGMTLTADWLDPDSTQEISNYKLIMENNTTNEITITSTPNTSEKTGYIYDSNSSLIAGTYYTFNILSMSGTDILASSESYTIIIGTNGVITTFTITDSNSQSITIKELGGGGGGEGGGEGEGGGSRPNYLAIKSVVQGYDASGMLLVVAVGESQGTATSIQTSTDGITWTNRTSALNNIKAVAFGQDPSGNNMFIAVGTGGPKGNSFNYVITSLNGIDWNIVHTISINHNLLGIAFGRSSSSPRWNIVGKGNDNTLILLTSSNGVNWTDADTSNFTGFISLNGITCSLEPTGTWIIVGEGTSSSIIRSVDGINWTQISSESNNPENEVFIGGAGLSVAYNSSNLWVAVGSALIAENGDSYNIATSTDSITWTRRISNLTHKGIAYGHDSSGGDLWIIVGTGNSAPTFSTSTDGINWTSSEFNNFFVGCVVYSQFIGITGKWIFGGDNMTHDKNIAYTSNPLSSNTLTYTVGEGDGGGGGGGGGGVGLPPGPVVDLYGLENSTSINLSWSQPSDGSVILTYNITELNSLITPLSVSANSGIDGAFNVSIDDLQPNIQYKFIVAASNSNGEGESSSTGFLSITSGVTTVPSAPTNITVVPSATSALVSWTPGSNGGSAITGYKVFCIPDNKRTNTAGANATSLNVTGLKNGTSYKFAVVATNSIGTSHTATCTPASLPGVPKVTVVGGNAQASLSWVTKHATGAATTSYTVTATPSVEGIPSPNLTALGGNVVVTGLINGTSYVFGVSATNVIGTSVVGASKAVIPKTVPSVPNSFSVVAGIKSFQVTWTAPTTNGGLPITEYTITYIAGVTTTVVKAKTVTPLMVTKLVTGTVYTITMQAKNKIGTSSSTSSVQVTAE